MYNLNQSDNFRRFLERDSLHLRSINFASIPITKKWFQQPDSKPTECVLFITNALSTIDFKMNGSPHLRQEEELVIGSWSTVIDLRRAEAYCQFLGVEFFHGESKGQYLFGSNKQL